MVSARRSFPGRKGDSRNERAFPRARLGRERRRSSSAMRPCRGVSGSREFACSAWAFRRGRDSGSWKSPICGNFRRLRTMPALDGREELAHRCGYRPHACPMGNPSSKSPGIQCCRISAKRKMWVFGMFGACVCADAEVARSRGWRQAERRANGRCKWAFSAYRFVRLLMS